MIVSVGMLALGTCGLIPGPPIGDLVKRPLAGTGGAGIDIHTIPTIYVNICHDGKIQSSYVYHRISIYV